MIIGGMNRSTFWANFPLSNPNSSRRNLLRAMAAGLFGWFSLGSDKVPASESAAALPEPVPKADKRTPPLVNTLGTTISVYDADNRLTYQTYIGGGGQTHTYTYDAQ